jgi:hypothetical protein
MGQQYANSSILCLSYRDGNAKAVKLSRDGSKISMAGK